MGAYILAVRKRLALLDCLWGAGVIFDHLVLCGGSRPAHSVKESLDIINKADGGLQLWWDWQPLAQIPSTEAAIMETVLLQSDLPLEWSNNYTVVNTPARTDRPEKPDPSAEDTILHWLKMARPKAGSSVLLVYSQPQLRHMEIVARRILERYDITVECVGYEAPGDINVSQVLDTIAKIIFELAKSYWSVRCKDEHGMTSGRVIVAAMDGAIAREEIKKIVSKWDDGSYVPMHAPLQGPFSSYKDACEAQL